MKRRALALLLACVTAASLFGLCYGLGVTALFHREAQHTADTHYGILALLPAEAPEVDPGENLWLEGDPRRSLIPLLREEEYAKLPPLVQKTVGSPGQLREWAMMDSTSLSVTGSHFQKSFEIMQKREKELALLPPDIRDRLAAFTAHMLHE